MNHFAKEMTKGAAIAAVLMMIFSNNPTHAATGEDESYFARSLARGAVEDVTPQQKYRTAIREAGGGYKESQRECARAGGDVKSCLREAKATYDRDMAEARRILGGNGA
ncbi:MAG: hypothetical protein ABI905_11350 [Betaproteobacteria bacterium]